MIISRTPFRVSLSGGGSDLPSFYTKHGGCVISSGLARYMYIAIHPSFQKNEIALKYSKSERVTNVADIEHNIFRQTLTDLDVTGVEITSFADAPAGTGLGSSSSFTVGLLHALYAYKGIYPGKERLASEACITEIEKLGEPIGKQDQYAATFGGLNYYEFEKNGTVRIEPIIMKPESYKKLENSLMMFYTGDVRSASEILKEQIKTITSGEREQAQLEICCLTKKLKQELEANNIDALGEILHNTWLLKKQLASKISNPNIDKWYEAARKAGAIGGKLLGAGGGGFLLFYVPQEKQPAVRETLSNLKEMKYRIDTQGSCIVYISH